MSTLKGCDRCKNQFIYKSEGSSHFNGIIYRIYQDGGSYEDHREWDFCTTCTELMEGPKVRKSTEEDYRQKYIHQLEINAGIVQPDDPDPMNQPLTGND